MRPAERRHPNASNEAKTRVVPTKRRDRRSISAPAMRSSTLPPADILDQAARRVGLVAALVIGVCVLQAMVSHLWPWLTRRDYPTDKEKWDLVGNLLVVAVSTATFAAVRWPYLSTKVRLRVGMAHLLLTAFLVSLTDHADHFWVGGHRLHGVPWVATLVLVFPVVIPMRPTHALLLGLAMAATSPLAMLAHVALLGYSMPDHWALLDAFPFPFAFVAAAIAKVLLQLGSEVGKARQLGAYTLETKIGAGGMGEVWTANHRFLARPAAIKLLRPSEGAPQHNLPERFEREAQATAALESPHTVQIFDFGTSDDGRLYYAMELLSGTDLETLIKRYGPQPPERVVYWLRQICHSLGEAHERGLVHRDIKPANLFVCKYGRDDDFIKVLDFGLVSLKSTRENPAPTLTATGHIIGTPSCMPPEMATHDQAADARSDLYALGCVAYYLLTGRHVFYAESAIEIVIGHVMQAPTPPSQVTSQPIPEELDRVVLACLAKSPENRPQTADELVDLLEGCHFERPWSLSRARTWWDETASAPNSVAI